MGMADRGWYRGKTAGRQSSEPGATGPGSRLFALRFVSAITWVIIANVVIHVLSQVLPQQTVMKGYPPQVPPMPMLQAYGHFSTALGFFGIEVWRFVTFQFLHQDLMHLFFNMFGLWMFGPTVEAHLGRRRFLAFTIVCGIFGAVAYLLLNFLESQVGVSIPGQFNNPYTPLIGASAGVFGVIMASAYLFPNDEVIALPLPIPIKLKHLAYGYVAIAAVSLLMGSRNAGGEAAHLGGAIAGFFFIRNAHLLRDFFDVLEDSRKPRGKRAGIERAPRGSTEAHGASSGAGSASTRPASVDTSSEQHKAAVDRVLEKVSRVGVEGLNADERATLERASKRT